MPTPPTIPTLTEDTTTTPEPLAPRGLATVTPLARVRPEAPLAPAVRATYTVQEVAKMLGLSRASVYAQLQAGEIPARRIGTRWIIAKHRFNT